MRAIRKLIAAFVLQAVVGSVSNAQDSPMTLFKSIPAAFSTVCTASNDEIQAYSRNLGEFSAKIRMKMEALRPLKIRAQSGAKLSANANTTALSDELDRTKKLISQKDSSADFDKALNSDAKKVLLNELDAIQKKDMATDDYREKERLMIEEHKARINYCKSASSRYLELLFMQKATVETDLASIVRAADLMQQINAKLLGTTYFPELSYENAYLVILDHVNYMNLLLGFSPGELPPGIDGSM